MIIGKSITCSPRKFVRIVVGKKVWRNNAFRLNLSEYCAASSKAFCLLVVENNYARWSDMVGSGEHGDKHNSASAPLYTNAGKSNQKMGLESPFRLGHSGEGYQRFDVIYNMVKADRAKDTRSGFKEELKRMVMEEYSKKRQAKKDDEEDGDEAVYLAHNFDDVVQGGINVELVIQSKPTQGNPNLGNISYNNNQNDSNDDEEEEEEEEEDNENLDERETVRMILIPINTTTTNCRTALEGTQLNFVWILT
jgi:hypothetical protein